MPIGAIIGAGTSLVGGLIGSSAAKAAAKTQAAAGQAVAGSIDKATGQAIQAGYDGITQANGAVDAGTAAANKYIGDAGTAQQGIYGNMTAGLQPYQAAGTYGLDKLQSTAGTFSFNPSDLENDPGYQFQLQQGQKALMASAAGRGMLQSGSLLKSMDNYSEGLAGTSYGNAYQRALTTFNTNQQGYQSLANLGQNANSQNLQAGSIYGGQLTSLAGLGANTNMQGAGLKSNVATQGNEYIGNTGLQGAEAAGQAILGGANATAAGQMGAANAWGSALNGVGNAAMTYGLGTMQSGGGGTSANPWAAATPMSPSAIQNPYSFSANPYGVTAPATPSIIGGGGVTPNG